MSRLMIVLSIVMLVLLAGCQPVRANAPAAEGRMRTITGDPMFFVPEWGNLGIAMFFDVREVDAVTHAATGTFNWRIVSPDEQEGAHSRLVDTAVKCVLFGKDVEGGDPATATIVSQITRREGWGQGEPGEYAFFWVRHTPDGDWSRNLSYQADPWLEFFPAAAMPPCDRLLTAEDVGGSGPPAEVGALEMSQ